MADISIQFHATPEENVSFADECAREFGLHLAAIRFHPFEIFLLKPEDVQGILSNEGIRRLALMIEPPTLPVETLDRFLDKNPDAMMLEIGRLVDDRLKESWLTTRASDTKATEVWKQVARKLKGRTQAGAVAVNPQTGATAKMRAHRFTEGARTLQAQGVVMLPVAGGSILKLGSEV